MTVKKKTAPKKKAAKKKTPATKKAAPKKTAVKKKAAARKPPKKKEKKLTDMETLFVESYLKFANARTAAREAGYSENMAKGQCYSWVSDTACPDNKRHVYNEIRRRQVERSKKSGIDAEWLLNRLAEEATADITDIYNENGGLKPVHEWPEIWRQGLVAGLDVEQQFVYEDGDKIPDGFLTKIKLSDRIKRLELIGRHVDVQAFKEKIEVSGNISLAERLSRAKERQRDGK